MKPRVAVAVALSATLGFAVQPASAAPKVDQQCAPKQPRIGYYGTTYSQSFRPTSKTVGRVDVLLGTTTTMALAPVRMRIVGRRVLADGLTAQVVVLAEQRVRLAMGSFQPTWVAMRLPKALAWAAAGPAVDEYAIEVALPAADDTLAWLACDRYDRGQASVNLDPGAPADVDTKTAVTATLGKDLSFRLYSTTR